MPIKAALSKNLNDCLDL